MNAPSATFVFVCVQVLGQTIVNHVMSFGARAAADALRSSGWIFIVFELVVL